MQALRFVSRWELSPPRRMSPSPPDSSMAAVAATVAIPSHHPPADAAGNDFPIPSRWLTFGVGAGSVFDVG